MNILGLGFDATDIPRVRTFRTLRRSLPAAGVHRRGDCLLYAAPQSGAAPRRPVRRKEAAMKALGTGHSRGVLWRTSRSSASAVRRNCGCTAARCGAPTRCSVRRFARSPSRIPTRWRWRRCSCSATDRATPVDVSPASSPAAARFGSPDRTLTVPRHAVRLRQTTAVSGALLAGIHCCYREPKERNR